MTGTLIAALVLQILSYVTQKECKFNGQRQAEGIAAAKAKGVKFGRAPKERTAEFYEILKGWRCGKVSARKAAAQLRIDHKTFVRWS